MDKSKKYLSIFTSCFVAFISFCSVTAVADPKVCDAMFEQVNKPGTVDVDLAKKSVDCYTSAVKSDPSNADAYYRLGVSHYLIGFSTQNISELEKSQAALKKAIELNPGHAQAKHQLVTTEGWMGMINQ